MVCGYSDDILLVAPSFDALQDVLSTCEKYAQEHDLQFSTNINPIKGTTKCKAFVKQKGLVLKEMVLCNNKLPRVNNIKHLGSVLTNGSNIMLDEFMSTGIMNFARNSTSHNLFNTSFYGSVLWDLFGAEASRLEKTWDMSLRKILKYATLSSQFL